MTPSTIDRRWSIGVEVLFVGSWAWDLRATVCGDHEDMARRSIT